VLPGGGERGGQAAQQARVAARTLVRRHDSVGAGDAAGGGVRYDRRSWAWPLGRRGLTVLVTHLLSNEGH
jgi:hypothetical protein